MDAIMDSFPSISEDRPVVTPAGRERAAFLGTRRDDLRDMVVLSRSSTYLAEISAAIVIVLSNLSLCNTPIVTDR